MKLEVATLLADANPELEYYDSYSGRGMYGQTTHGVVGTTDELMRAIGNIIKNYTPIDRNLIGDDLMTGGWRTDSMGQWNSIFY